MRGVLRVAADGTCVLEAPFGAVRGRLHGGTGPAPVGPVDVELTLDVVATAGMIIRTGPASARVAGDVTVIVGCIEGVDDDGVGGLRLAPDCLVLLETDGGVPSGVWVELRVAPESVGVFVLGG